MIDLFWHFKEDLDADVLLCKEACTECSVLASVKLGLCSSVLSEAISAAPRVGSTRPIFNSRLNKYPLSTTQSIESALVAKRQEPVC